MIVAYIKDFFWFFDYFNSFEYQLNDKKFISLPYNLLNNIK